MCPPDTILCKPIMISSCQQFLKSEIHNSNLRTHYAYQLFSQPWDSSHKVWLFHMVYSDICHGLTLIFMLQTIYLKPKLQSAKHLVSLDAYNLFIATTITEAFSEFIKKIQILPAVSHISVYQSSFNSCNHYHINNARFSHIIHAI